MTYKLAKQLGGWIFWIKLRIKVWYYEVKKGIKHFSEMREFYPSLRQQLWSYYITHFWRYTPKRLWTKLWIKLQGE